MPTPACWSPGILSTAPSFTAWINEDRVPTACTAFGLCLKPGWLPWLCLGLWVKSDESGVKPQSWILCVKLALRSLHWSCIKLNIFQSKQNSASYTSKETPLISNFQSFSVFNQRLFKICFAFLFDVPPHLLSLIIWNGSHQSVLAYLDLCYEAWWSSGSHPASSRHWMQCRLYRHRLHQSKLWSRVP